MTTERLQLTVQQACECSGSLPEIHHEWMGIDELFSYRVPTVTTIECAVCQKPYAVTRADVVPIIITDV